MRPLRIGSAPLLLTTHRPTDLPTCRRTNVQVDDPLQLRDERRELLRIAGADPNGEACVWLMVQRLAPEQSTMTLLAALAALVLAEQQAHRHGIGLA